MELKELEHILEFGTVSEIRNCVIPHFHSIKHTVSFMIILDRLEEALKKDTGITTREVDGRDAISKDIAGRIGKKIRGMFEWK